MIIQIIALVCSAEIDRSDCSVSNARDVAVIGKAANEIECAVMSQQTMGGVAVFQNLAPGEYVKVICYHKSQQRN